MKTKLRKWQVQVRWYPRGWILSFYHTKCLFSTFLAFPLLTALSQHLARHPQKCSRHISSSPEYVYWYIVSSRNCRADPFGNVWPEMLVRRSTRTPLFKIVAPHCWALMFVAQFDSWNAVCKRRCNPSAFTVGDVRGVRGL